MTKITYFTKPEDDFFYLKVDGHAGYAEKGGDIVCAAVSALACTLSARVMDTTAEACYDVYADKEHGRMLISASGKHAMEAFETVLTGLKDVAYAFPEYVSVTETEQNNGGV